MIGAPVTGVRPTPDACEQRCERRMQVLATAFGEVAGEDPQQLVQVRAQRAVGCLLNAEVLEHRHAVGARDPACGGAQQFLVDAAALRVVADRHVAQHVADGVGTVDVLGQKRLVAQVFLHQHRGHRRQAPCVGSGPHPQVDVGHLGGVGDHRIDDDHRPARVLGDLVEHHARPREALRHPGVLADEHRHLGVFELASGVPAVEVRVDPRLAGFLLRQRIGPVARTERLEERAAVGAAEMVTLPAAAVVEDLVAAVRVADVLEARGDLGDRGVPVDFLVAAVGPSTHRGRQPAAVVLVVIEPQRLVAGVALRCRVFLVTADLGELAAFELHDDAAVAFAQDARGRLPFTGHRDFLSAVSACSSARSWRCTRSRGLTSREARATTIAPSIDVVTSIASSSARAAAMPSATNRWAMRSVHRAKAAAARSITGVACFGLFGGITRFDRHRDDRTPRPVVGADQLLAIAVDQVVEDVEAALAPWRSARRCTRPRNRLPHRAVACGHRGSSGRPTRAAHRCVRVRRRWRSGARRVPGSSSAADITIRSRGLTMPVRPFTRRPAMYVTLHNRR